MGTRNKERRAAKKKARDRRATQAHNDDFDPYAPPPAEVIGNAVLDAAYRHAGSDTDALADCVSWLRSQPARLVDTGMDMALRHTVAHMWKVGWLPYDVARHLGKQLGEPAVALMTDAIAADAAQYAEATVHERWREQLRQIDAAVWWQPDQPHLSQWIARDGIDRADALTFAVTVMAEMMTWPALPVILPPPGSARSAPSTRHSVDPKILSRVRGLLAKAESTEFAEEAEALSAKAQELMNRHAVERAMLDADDHVPQVATARRIWLDSPYVAAKAHLVGAVADANRCRTVIHEKIGFVALMGDEMDLEITELLATSLLLQATRALVAAGRAGQSRIRSYRQSFLMAYADRIGERLAAVTESALSSEPDDRLLPVLVDRRKAVEELFATMYPSTRTKSYSVSNAAGWGAGRAAADRADLGLDRKGLPSS